MKLPPLISQNKTPKIFWYQNDGYVVIRIMLCDVKNYILKITRDHFKFRTNLNAETYTLCFQLFGGVRPEGISHINLLREIKVFLPKTLKFWDWLRLTFHKEKKNHLVVMDPDHIHISDWRNQMVLFSRKKNIDRGPILHFDPSDRDRDDSDDERWELAYDHE